jgi:hypothetical protein
MSDFHRGDEAEFLINLEARAAPLSCRGLLCHGIYRLSHSVALVIVSWKFVPLGTLWSSMRVSIDESRPKKYFWGNRIHQPSVLQYNRKPSIFTYNIGLTSNRFLLCGGYDPEPATGRFPGNPREQLWEANSETGHNPWAVFLSKVNKKQRHLVDSGL